MTDCKTHENHAHVHGSSCGHKRVKHDGHEDFLHDGHMHHVHDGHVDEHQVPVSAGNPSTCTPAHACKKHDDKHQHGPGCGHEAVPHGDHVDYVVSGHLHHQHGTHCDDHGPVNVSA